MGKVLGSFKIKYSLEVLHIFLNQMIRLIRH